MGLAVDRGLSDRLDIYYRLLTRWNQKINLTGFDLEGTEAIDRLLVEPLIAARFVRPEARRGIDIGSGGGSPAIPLALVLPTVSMVLVEAKTRKSAFLREALRSLELEGEVVTARFEELLVEPGLHESHDLLTIRAVRLEPRTLFGLQAFVRPGGELLLFRPGAPNPSLPSMTPPLTWKAMHPLLDVPASHLQVIEKTAIGRI
jgi:16S rRNA (guanine527-N7)-methyltransferase